MIEKYIGRVVEIVYLDRKGKNTQRKIQVMSVKDGKVKAYCIVQQAPRVFIQDRILAFQPLQTRAAL